MTANKTKYFWKEVGLNADIERHRAKEQELRAMIIGLESIDNPDQFQVRALATYRHFLYLLELSKAEVVSKIGKKK